MRYAFLLNLRIHRLPLTVALPTRPLHHAYRPPPRSYSFLLNERDSVLKGQSGKRHKKLSSSLKKAPFYCSSQGWRRKRARPGGDMRDLPPATPNQNNKTRSQPINAARAQTMVPARVVTVSLSADRRTRTSSSSIRGLRSQPAHVQRGGTPGRKDRSYVRGSCSGTRGEYCGLQVYVCLRVLFSFKCRQSSSSIPANAPRLFSRQQHPAGTIAPKVL